MFDGPKWSQNGHEAHEQAARLASEPESALSVVVVWRAGLFSTRDSRYTSRITSCCGNQAVVDFFLADDSRQPRPSVPGLGPLTAAGGILVSERQVRSLAEAVGDACDRWGFPPGESFKWSPGPELWMHGHLGGHFREGFFKEVLWLASLHDAVAVVVVTDTRFGKVNGAPTHELSVTRMLMERINLLCERRHSLGQVLVDRPPGDRKAEVHFLADCMSTIDKGTEYVKFENLLWVHTAPSKVFRLLQLADLVTSCSVAAVSGSDRAWTTFGDVRNLMDASGGRVGGYGLKLYPRERNANLYHWLVGDTSAWTGGTPLRLPSPGSRFATDPYERRRVQTPVPDDLPF